MVAESCPANLTNEYEDDSLLNALLGPQTSPAFGPASESISIGLDEFQLLESSSKGKETGFNGDLYDTQHPPTQSYRTISTTRLSSIHIERVEQEIEIEVDELAESMEMVVKETEVEQVSTDYITTLLKATIASPSPPIEKLELPNPSPFNREDSLNFPSSSSLVANALLSPHKPRTSFPADMSIQSGGIPEELGPQSSGEPDIDNSAISSTRIMPRVENSAMVDDSMITFGPETSTPAFTSAAPPLPLSEPRPMINLLPLPVTPPSPVIESSMKPKGAQASGHYQSAATAEEVRKANAEKVKVKPKSNWYDNQPESSEKGESLEELEEVAAVVENEPEKVEGNGEKDMSNSQIVPPVIEPTVPMEEDSQDPSHLPPTEANSQNSYDPTASIASEFPAGHQATGGTDQSDPPVEPMEATFLQSILQNEQEDYNSLSGIGDLQSSMELPSQYVPEMTQTLEAVTPAQSEDEEEDEDIPPAGSSTSLRSRQPSIPVPAGRELRRVIPPTTSEGDAVFSKNNEHLAQVDELEEDSMIVEASVMAASSPVIKAMKKLPTFESNAQIPESLEKTQEEPELPIIDDVRMDEIMEDVEAKDPGIVIPESEDPTQPSPIAPIPASAPVKSPLKKSVAIQDDLPVETPVKKIVSPILQSKVIELPEKIVESPPAGDAVASTSKAIIPKALATPKVGPKPIKKALKGKPKRLIPVDSPDQLDLFQKSQVRPVIDRMELEIVNETLEDIEMDELLEDEITKPSSSASPRAAVSNSAGKKRAVNFDPDVSDKRRKVEVTTKKKKKNLIESKEIKKKSKKVAPGARKNVTTRGGRRASIYVESSSSETEESEAEVEVKSNSKAGASRRNSGGLLDSTPFTRVFAKWRDDRYFYPGTIVGRVGRDLKIQFDDDSRGTLKYDDLRRCELLQGDIVRYRGDDLDTETQVVAYDGDLKILRVERGEKGDDVLPGEPMQADDVAVATVPSIPNSEQKNVKNKQRIVIASACIPPEHSALLDSRRFTAEDIAAFDGIALAPVEKVVNRKAKAKAPAKITAKSSSMFTGFAFLVTKVSYDDIVVPGRKEKKRAATANEINADKAAYAKLLVGHGAKIIEQKDLFTLDSTDVEHLSLNFSTEFEEIHTILSLADRPSSTPKYLIALALGIPCISREFVKSCVEADELLKWNRFVITSGWSQELKTWAMGGQTEALLKTEFNLDSLEESQKVFEGASFLVVLEKHGKKAAEFEGQKTQLRSVLAAAGCARVEFAATMAEAGTAEDYDYVSLDEKAKTSSALSKHEGVCSFEWIKQCLIHGLRLNTVSRLKEVTPTF